ncbi:aminotransferase class III-fold pyridoxal phosphate-dependent enzyme [Streptomyces pseudogriseolus]|uniref:aminotransferase class III-fold pyridoxal phosphate-dependent enzyme n=1 Tax=Streptomyces pseudogriseolus TaxID=36817 RepID=UPI003FA2940A
MPCAAAIRAADGSEVLAAARSTDDAPRPVRHAGSRRTPSRHRPDGQPGDDNTGPRRPWSLRHDRQARRRPGRQPRAGVPLQHTVPVPYDDPADDDEQAAARLALSLDGAAARAPVAAVVVKTVQGEGGVNPARPAWLRALAAWTREHGALLIVDDLQTGCGRTGPFFSFEPAGIVPDIICLSKSISGYGTPMALTLMRPDYDVWRPGEHNGTFRGYNPAFVTAARALEVFWSDGTLQARTTASGEKVGRALTGLAQRYGLPAPRGRGLAWGLPFDRPGTAREVRRAAYRAGLLVETAGPQDEVLKILPPLTIGYEQSEKGLGILDEAIASTAGR